MSRLSLKKKLINTRSPIKTVKKRFSSEGQCLDGVFLGGSCNPTTWRKDIAIPFLEENRIAYFNPQLDEWRPELIAQEAAAKKRASFLLFVFQPHLTRGVASLVEVAYLAALLRPRSRPNSPFRLPRRRLLIVRPPPPTHSVSRSSDQCINKCATPAEAACLEAAYEWLEGLRFPHVLFFKQLEEALLHIKTLHHYTSHTNKLSVKHSSKQNSERMRKTRDRLLAACQYSPLYREVAGDLTVDFYCGGEPLKNLDIGICAQGKDEPISASSWILCRQHAQCDFELSMAMQHRCNRLYFHISRHGLWIVEQMEAAFAIGSGREVILCIEYLSDGDAAIAREEDLRSGAFSGCCSLATTPDEIFQPANTTEPITNFLAYSSLSPLNFSPLYFDSFSHSAGTELNTMPEAMALIDNSHHHHHQHQQQQIVRTVISNVEGTRSKKNISVVGIATASGGVSGLTPLGIKDHNRSRSYLKSILEESVREEGGRGILIPRPIEDISALLLFL